MTYPETIHYLESFLNYEKILWWRYKKSLKLERIRDFLASLDNPQDNLSCIHVAGTKGKGSTCAFIAYILREAGFKVGLYTSPHLCDFRERIRILQSVKRKTQNENKDFEGMISRREITALVERLKPEIDKYCRNSKYGPLSFFEVYTALAFLYFKEKKVDFAVLETGLGGRLDATNTVRPLVSVFTPISYEHTDILGKTLAAIAKEKAGIIKSGSDCRRSKAPIVISAPQPTEAMQVIRRCCRKAGAKLYLVNRDMGYKKTNHAFVVRGLNGIYSHLRTKLIGGHQLINATAAIGAVEALRRYNIYIGKQAIKQGIARTFWPARCEVIHHKPLVVLDGAQNIASAQALKKAIRENFSAKGARLPDGQESAPGGKYQRLILVLGISQDKDTSGICRELYSLADEVVLTQSSNPRATRPEILARYFKGKQIKLTPDVKTARREALRQAKDKDLILVCGSLFVSGEFRNEQL